MGPRSIEFVPLDVTDPQQLQDLGEYLKTHEGLLNLDKHGIPDLVINNAGVCIKEEEQEGGMSGQALQQIYETVLNVNAWGPVRLVEDLCLPRMRQRGYV